MHRESSLNDSQNVDNIFAEGLSSPECVTILVNCLKNVKKHSKTELTKNSQVKGEHHLLELKKTATLISEKFDKYERKKSRKRENY